MTKGTCIWMFLLICSSSSAIHPAQGEIICRGELKQWHTVTLLFEGPELVELRAAFTLLPRIKNQEIFE